LFLFISGYSLALNKTHPGYELDKKQFFINRLLRIFPIWIVCILILSLTHHLSGVNVFTLLLLQTQDVPPATAFTIAWSIQLEFMCYLLFPVMLSAVAARKNILGFYVFFLLVRVCMYMMPTSAVWQLSYGTVFGGGTIFLTGILAASLPPLQDHRIARIYLASGLGLFCAIAVFIWKSGGWQKPEGVLIHWFFLVMPEILAGTVLLIIRGALTRQRVPSETSRRASLFRSVVFAGLAHFGRVSYSAYMFSLLVLSFTQSVFGFITPSGWLSLISAGILYFLALTAFSTASFYAIELPFLRMRSQYIHAGPKSATRTSAAM
jgi:peptidoglycan/LPS O-acetylase OafA/YrhL